MMSYFKFGDETVAAGVLPAGLGSHPAPGGGARGQQQAQGDQPPVKVEQQDYKEWLALEDHCANECVLDVDQKIESSSTKTQQGGDSKPQGKQIAGWIMSGCHKQCTQIINQAISSTNDCFAKLCGKIGEEQCQHYCQYKLDPHLDQATDLILEQYQSMIQSGESFAPDQQKSAKSLKSVNTVKKTAKKAVYLVKEANRSFWKAIKWW